MLTGPIKLSSTGPWDERKWQRCLRNKKVTAQSWGKYLRTEQHTTLALGFSAMHILKGGNVNKKSVCSSRKSYFGIMAGSPSVVAKILLRELSVDLLCKPTWIYNGSWKERMFSLINCYGKGLYLGGRNSWWPFKTRMVIALLQLRMWGLERQSDLLRPHWAEETSIWDWVPRNSWPQTQLWGNQKNQRTHAKSYFMAPNILITKRKILKGKTKLHRVLWPYQATYFHFSMLSSSWEEAEL